MKAQNIIKLAPLLILLAAKLWLLYSITTGSILMTQNHVIGLILLGLVLSAQVMNEQTGYIATFILLFIGTFAFASVTPVVYIFHSGVIKIDLFCTAIFVLFCTIHWQTITGWMFESLTEK